MYFGEIFAVPIALAIVLGVTIYLYMKYVVYLYWQRRGIKYVEPSFPFGNNGKSFMQKISNAEEMVEIYNSTREPFVGTFGIFRPILFVRDPNLIRSILIKDFQHFVNRGVHYDEKNDPLSAHLFAIDGQSWKNLRAKLSPTFTSGKLKAMFTTLTDCGIPLINAMNRAAHNQEVIEAREITARYATNVIASVAFGLETNCIDDLDAPFRKYGRKFFDVNIKNGIRWFGMFVCPQLLKILKMRLIDKDVEDFMINVVEQTLELREKNKMVRKDFFQLLVQLRNSGTVQLDDQWETVITNDNCKQFSVKELAAHAFVFFIAGFETTSATMSFCMYELAKNTEIQRKVQNEIDTVLERHGGQMTYDSLNEMKYLDCCIDEALRKYPIPAIVRICDKDYTIPGTNLTIEKGTSVTIPVYAIHKDPQYYPDPEVFDPSRFSDENSKDKRPFLPFGDGPRNCIGMRLGKMQTKVGVATMLHKFSYELDARHIDEDLKFSPSTFVLTPADGINLKVKQRL